MLALETTKLLAHPVMEVGLCFVNNV